MKAMDIFTFNEAKESEFYEAEFFKMQEIKEKCILSLRKFRASQNAADFFEYCCDRFEEYPCVSSVDHSSKFTFGELDSYANRVASWASIQGLKSGDTVALLMENRPEYLFITIGLAKIGITIALINTNIKEKILHHSISVSQCKIILVSASKKSNWVSCLSLIKEPLDVWWFADELFELPGNSNYLTNNLLSMKILEGYSKSRPSKLMRNSVNERDPLFYIFTSGTTGPSKAAKFSHRRFIGAAVTWAGPSGLEAGDRYYVTLPLYHGNAGVVAAAMCYFLGVEIVLRKKFSASNFFSDIRQHNCKATIYIGELWRYLNCQPVSENEGTPEFSPLRVIIGNGLRPDVWNHIAKRFFITHVVEHYGSTEMPGDAILNYFNKPGSCGYLPVSETIRKQMTGEGGVIVKYDIEEDRVYRSNTNMCEKCDFGEIGELIMRLPDGKYDGYVGESATRRKLYKNVFENGDSWWSSGDLLKMDEIGFFYFVDRAGDSFRWKGENVSTNEVCEAINVFEGIDEANVYGVQIPHTDGRAGMACIVLTSSSVPSLVDVPNGFLPSLSNFEIPGIFDFRRFNLHMEKLLPVYARPLFLRFRITDNDKTSTLKFQKFKYVNDGFDPERCGGDLVWVNLGKYGTYSGWSGVDKDIFKNITEGKYRF